MDETKEDSPKKSSAEASSSNGNVASSRDEPLMYATEISLPSYVDKTYVSEMMVLLMRSSRNSAAAAASQSWKPKQPLISNDEPEPEMIRDASRNSDNIADVTLSTEFIDKVNELKLEEDVVEGDDDDDDFKEWAINLSDCSEFEGASNNDTICLSSDEEKSPEIVPIKHRDSVLLAKKDRSKGIHNEDSAGSSLYENSIEETESDLTTSLNTTYSIRADQSNTNVDLDVSMPQFFIDSLEMNKTIVSGDDSLSSSSLPTSSSSLSIELDDFSWMNLEGSPKGKRRLIDELPPWYSSPISNRSNSHSPRDISRSLPTKFAHGSPPSLMMLSPPESVKRARSTSLKNEPSTAGSPSSSTKQAKNSALLMSLIKPCSVVLERYNPLKCTKVSPLNNHESSDILATAEVEEDVSAIKTCELLKG